SGCCPPSASSSSPSSSPCATNPNLSLRKEPKGPRGCIDLILILGEGEILKFLKIVLRPSSILDRDIPSVDLHGERVRSEHLVSRWPIDTDTDSGKVLHGCLRGLLTS